jgi:hypothetical protein
MELSNVKGLSRLQQEELQELLEERAKDLAMAGSVMMCELVQVVEDFLLIHNEDPNLSAWEQMKAREASAAMIMKKQQHQQQGDVMRLLLSPDDEHGGEAIMSPTSSHHQDSASLKMDDTSASTMSRQRQQQYPTNHYTATLERELARQKQALENAAKLRQQPIPTIPPPMMLSSAMTIKPNHNVSSTSDDDDDNDDNHYDNDSSNDEEDDDDDEKYHNPDDHFYHGTLPQLGSSRYQTDFIELGVLGRGGGGEVVKVRNRLDRRICTCVDDLVTIDTTARFHPLFIASLLLLPCLSTCLFINLF